MSSPGKVLPRYYRGCWHGRKSRRAEPQDNGDNAQVQGMKQLIPALALALAAAPAAAQTEGVPLNPDEAVSIAVGNSPAALAAEQDIIIARQRVSEARFLALPQFTLSGSMTRMDLEYPAVLGQDLGGPFIDQSAGAEFYSVRAQAQQPR